MDGPGSSEGLPHTTAEAFAQESAGPGTEAAAEAAAERAEKAGREVTIDDVSQEEVATILKDALPELSKEESMAFASNKLDSLKLATTIAELNEKEDITNEEAARFAGQMQHYNRNQIERFLNGTKLDDDAREKILSFFPEMEAADKAKDEEKESMSDKEAEVKGGIADTVRQQAEVTADKVSDEIDARVSRGEITENEKVNLKEKTQRLLQRIKGNFAEGEKGREWARRVGKGTYYALLMAFILLLVEMNLINKAASSSSRRRG